MPSQTVREDSRADRGGSPEQGVIGMKAVVVYESHWGNTAAVARAVAEGIGPDAMALNTDEATAAEMDGVELRSRMLRDPSLASIPIVVVSAIAGLAQAGLTHVKRIFRKPVPIDNLVELVAELIEDPNSTGDL